jgi:hypothetical protein
MISMSPETFWDEHDQYCRGEWKNQEVLLKPLIACKLSRISGVREVTEGKSRIEALDGLRGSKLIVGPNSSSWISNAVRRTSGSKAFM